MAPRRPSRKRTHNESNDEQNIDQDVPVAAAAAASEDEETSRLGRSSRTRVDTDAEVDTEANTNANASTNAGAESSRRSVAAHVRDRQRAVAEREAGRLARPEAKRTARLLPHADTSKSAVASTPSGVVASVKAKHDTVNETEAEEWCGPFSVARQLIAKREQAKRLREQEQDEEGMSHHPLDQAMKELEMEQQRKQHPSMQWKASFRATGTAANTTATATAATLSSKSSSKSSFYAKRQQRVDLSTNRFKIPSLFDLCVSFVINNFANVESLGVDMDSTVRAAIAKALAAAHKLDAAALHILAETGVEALNLPDCSNLNAEELEHRLPTLIPAGLRYLVLDQCGRCFTKPAVQALVAHTTDTSDFTTSNAGNGNTKGTLEALSIGGAYALDDEDAANLVKHLAPSTLAFKACNLLGSAVCISIGASYGGANGRPRCLLELTLEDIPLSTTDLNILTSYPDAFGQLQTLSLRRIDGLDDVVVVTLLQMTALTLEALDLTDNHALTDVVLEGLRLYDPRRLQLLNLTGLTSLTAVGLEALFTTVQGAAAPPCLKTLVLAKCDTEVVTDDVIRLATLAATQNRRTDTATTVGGSTKNPKPSATTLFLSGGGLVNLNVQGSSTLTDTAMEHLAATSSHTLQTLNVSYCTKLTDRGLGYLVDQCGKQLATVSVWGNAQLSDDLFDGHVRSNDPSLEVVGVWMKNNTSRTIR